MNTLQEREALRHIWQDGKTESMQAAEYWTKRAATMHRNAVEALREAGEIPINTDLNDVQGPGVYTANAQPVKLEDLPKGPYSGLPISTVKMLTGEIKPEDLRAADLTGETAQAVHAAAERMRRGEQRVEAITLGSADPFRAIVEAAHKAAVLEQQWREEELCSKRAPIIAVDFDGTLCENAWPEIGEPKLEVIQVLIHAQEAGARLILWTNRVGTRLREAVDWSEAHGLTFDAVNENLPETLAKYTTNPRKVCADIYLDDKATQPTGAALAAIWGAADRAAAERKEQKK